MNILIKNCSHHSSIFVVQDENKFIYKSSSLSRGIQDLKNEISGYKWYNSFLLKKIHIGIEIETENYLRLKMNYIDARVPDVSKGYHHNINYIELAIRHYADIWGSMPSDLSGYPLHGDYSIEGNILFSNKSVFVIDWEHFSEDVAPIGFDGLYLLFETFWLDKSGNKETLNHIAEMIKFLKKRKCLAAVFEDSPLASTISFMRANRHIWGEQFLKMPIISFSDVDVMEIDEYLRAQN